MQGPSYTNSIGMEFVLIPAGSFQMGSSSEAERCEEDEKPRHEVTISRPFYLGKHPVTRAQWKAVMGKNNPGYWAEWKTVMRQNNPGGAFFFMGANRPVVWVNWEVVQEFIAKLNAKEGHDRYRLPTEAEWEYAARAGSASAYSFGDDRELLGRHAWYKANSGNKTHPVGRKRPNAWGLHDMHGNVWELVRDWYGPYPYDAEAVTDPQGPGAGVERVLRGGCCDSGAGSCRSASRSGIEPDFCGGIAGFRLALSPGD